MVADTVNNSPDTVSCVERKADSVVYKSGNKTTKKRYAAKHTRLSLLDIARQEIGKKEIPKGSNWGGDIPKYLKSVNITYPSPWCMAFCFWVVEQYAQQEGIKNPLYKTGHVGKQNQMSAALRVKVPKPGDIFIMIFKDGSGHCGFVERVEGSKVYTIEGNSNNDGSANGYEVCRKNGGREIKEIRNFLRVVR